METNGTLYISYKYVKLNISIMHLKKCATKECQPTEKGQRTARCWNTCIFKEMLKTVTPGSQLMH
jgi:hypothetical protein